MPFVQYCFWLDIGSTYGRITSRDVDEDADQIERSDSLEGLQLIHPTANIFIRFIEDMKVDEAISRHALELQERRYTSTMRSFFGSNLDSMKSDLGHPATFLVGVNLIAHWANLGQVGEAVIRNQIPQSLIPHSRLRSPGGRARHPVQTGRRHI